VHFAQWSYHISFPDLATIPLIYLRKFYETTTIESLRRVVKRFIDQVNDFFSKSKVLDYIIVKKVQTRYNLLLRLLLGNGS
jgi:hypothetical protein